MNNTQQQQSNYPANIDDFVEFFKQKYPQNRVEKIIGNKKEYIKVLKKSITIHVFLKRDANDELKIHKIFVTSDFTRFFAISVLLIYFAVPLIIKDMQTISLLVIQLLLYSTLSILFIFNLLKRRKEKIRVMENIDKKYFLNGKRTNKKIFIKKDE